MQMKVNLFITNIPQANMPATSRKDRAKFHAQKPKEVPFTSAQLTPNDFRYKVAIIKGLFEKFNIKVSLEDIESIVAPDELKELLKNFKPKDFMTGKLEQEQLFDNVRAKKFRVNLHSHTRYSDGHMRLKDFLDQSAAYADEVAKTKPADDLPPYTTAITDHNVVDGVKDAIFAIAKNPDKYKNMKFVPGCEFMFYDTKNALESPYFEAVSLGLNPFDKAFSLGRCGFYDRIGLLPKMKEYGGIISYAHPMRKCQHNAFSPRLLEYLKHIGINGMESEYQYLGFTPTQQVLEQIEHVRKVTKDFNWFQTGGTDTHGKNIFHTKAEPLLDTEEFDWLPRNLDETLKEEYIGEHSQISTTPKNSNWIISSVSNLLKSNDEKNASTLYLDNIV